LATQQGSIKGDPALSRCQEAPASVAASQFRMVQGCAMLLPGDVVKPSPMASARMMK
jgi:hypothetical protein